VAAGETPEEVAAEKAGDPDRLMPGEDPDTTFLDDAKHWRSVYEELLSFKYEMVDKTEDKMEEVSPPAARELASTDKVVLGAELERMRHRFEFWDRRCREMEQQPTA
jgi:hypothetical protein